MMKYSNETTIGQYRSGGRPKYLFFWGHQPAADGRVTQSCLSQWWIAPFEVAGILYPTAEHWMMAEKARLFGDEATCAQIIAAAKPGAVKQLGRTISSFDPVVWDAHKPDIVIAGNYHKFSQHDTLKTFLLQTDDRILVEASPVDAVWGIGRAADHPSIENPETWKGQNLLGYALMEVRDRLLHAHL